MKPVLFEHNLLDFSGHGLGTLADATSCKVSCEENGAYDLTMTYPIVGTHARDLAERRIILAKPSPRKTASLFASTRSSGPWTAISRYTLTI